jgi:hypothetical protein
MNSIGGHAGLYVAREPDNTNSLWAATTAIREPLERVERSWRGIVMDTYALEKLTNWTPELSPPPDSPLFRWRVLAGDLQEPRRLQPERCHSGAHEARTRNLEIPRCAIAHLRSGPSDHPGMTRHIT